MSKPAHPMQPIWMTPEGVARFVHNDAVKLLLAHSQRHGFGLNELMLHDISPEDRMQLAQLLGYSVSGFGDLSYADPDVVAEADAKVRELLRPRCMHPRCGREVEEGDSHCGRKRCRDYVAVTEGIPAGELAAGEFFRKKGGTYVYMVVSESSAEFHNVHPAEHVFGVCFNGNMCAVKKDKQVVRMERETFFGPAEEQKRWEEAVGANPEADDE